MKWYAKAHARAYRIAAMLAFCLVVLCSRLRRWQHWHLETEVETKNPISAGILTYADAQGFSARSEPQPSYSSTQSLVEESFCSACGGEDSMEGNAIVLCDGCNVAVHQVWH